MAENDPRRGGIVVGIAVRGGVTGRMIVGFVVITLGVLWTLDNLGLVDSGAILRWWPVLLIAIGLAKLAGIGTRQHTIWGTTFAVAGALFLAASLGYVRFGIWHLWPLALIAIGANMLVRSSVSRRPRFVGSESGDPADVVACCSGVQRKVYSTEFRSASVTAVMGGAEVDFREAKIAGEGAVLDLFVWWGGVEIRVPEDWKVLNEATVLMGGIEEKTRAAPADSRQVLRLRGLILMGGVEIRN